MYTPVKLDLRPIVRQIPPGILPAVRGVSRRVVSQKLQERVAEMRLRSVVPAGE